MDGIVRALFIFPRSKVPVSVQSVEAIATGLAGDFHSESPTGRQILLLSTSVLDRLGLQPGALFENLDVDDIDVMALSPGQRVRIGEGLFEVTVPCEPCRQMNKIRPGLKAALSGCRGMFVRVVLQGTIRVGDKVEVPGA